MNKHELIQKKKFPDDYKGEVLNRIDKIAFGKNDDDLKVFGTFSYKLPYASDIDVLENFVVNGDKELAVKQLSTAIKKWVKEHNVRRENYIFEIIEFKIGTDLRYNINIGELSKGIYYPKHELLQISKIMMGKKLLTQAEYKLVEKTLKDPKYELRGYYTPEAYDLINEIFREHKIIRWNATELAADLKILPGNKKISIIESLATPGDIKVDVITDITSSYVEMTNFIILMTQQNGQKFIENYDQPYTDDFVDNEIEQNLPMNIEELFYSKFHYNPFKGIKRLFALARHRGDNNVLQRILPILTSSEAHLYKLKANLSALKRSLEDLNDLFGNVSYNKVNQYVIFDRIDFEVIEHIYLTIQTLLLFSEDELQNIQKLLLKIIDFSRGLLKGKVGDQIDILDNIIAIFETKLKNHAIEYLKQVQLFPIPCNYLPEKLRYINACNAYYEQIYREEYSGTESSDYDEDEMSEISSEFDPDDKLINEEEAPAILGIEDELSDELSSIPITPYSSPVVSRPTSPVIPPRPITHPLPGIHEIDQLIENQPGIEEYQDIGEVVPENQPIGPPSEQLPTNPPQGNNWWKYGKWVVAALAAAALAYGAYKGYENKDKIKENIEHLKDWFPGEKKDKWDIEKGKPYEHVSNLDDFLDRSNFEAPNSMDTPFEAIEDSLKNNLDKLSRKYSMYQGQKFPIKPLLQDERLTKEEREFYTQYPDTFLSQKKEQLQNVGLEDYARIYGTQKSGEEGLTPSFEGRHGLSPEHQIYSNLLGLTEKMKSLRNTVVDKIKQITKKVPSKTSKKLPKKQHFMDEANTQIPIFETPHSVIVPTNVGAEEFEMIRTPQVFNNPDEEQEHQMENFMTQQQVIHDDKGKEEKTEEDYARENKANKYNREMDRIGEQIHEVATGKYRGPNFIQLQEKIAAEYEDSLMLNKIRHEREAENEMKEAIELSKQLAQKSRRERDRRELEQEMISEHLNRPQYNAFQQEQRIRPDYNNIYEETIDDQDEFLQMMDVLPDEEEERGKYYDERDDKQELDKIINELLKEQRNKYYEEQDQFEREKEAAELKRLEQAATKALKKRKDARLESQKQFASQQQELYLPYAFNEFPLNIAETEELERAIEQRLKSPKLSRVTKKLISIDRQRKPSYFGQYFENVNAPSIPIKKEAIKKVPKIPTGKTVIPIKKVVVPVKKVVKPTKKTIPPVPKKKNK